jgi:signal transduction histidine kinase
VSLPPVAMDVTIRAGSLARDANLVWVAQVLRSHREAILDRWLDAASAQPFHDGRRDHAVADDIPALLDALIEFLLRHGPPSIDAGPPLEEPEIRAAAQRHSRARVLQGLQPADVVVEFRLLRQEIWRTLRTDLPDDAPVDDVSAATLLVNDALDGAISLAIEALLERVEHARKQVLATILHDLRTPITSVKGWAQLILRREQPDPSMAQPILDAANRLQRMTDDLLEIGEIEGGQLELKRQPTDGVALVRSAVEALAVIAQGHTIRFDEPNGTIVGDWDGERLDRVLQNLLTNAVKYSPPGTEIRVKIVDRGSLVEISVQDHGLGLPPEAADRIFDEFYRVREHASGAEGLGLGLFIARSIVEAHGGQIRAESEGTGLGTTILVTLPKLRLSEPTL